MDVSISRLLKKKELIQLKKGLYVTANYAKMHQKDISYTFALANILHRPSYISSWSALQYYNLTTEAIYETISVGLKTTRNYSNPLGSFKFFSIKKDLFTDFSLVKTDCSFLIASPAKALFDMLYFRTRRFSSLSTEDVKTILFNLRINMDEMPKREEKKFYKMLKTYLLTRRL